MFRIIYIEAEVANHPVTLDILGRFPDAVRVSCERYTEIFNRKSQDFRLQKKQPALILAKKIKQYVLPTPDNFHVGSRHNYYFSHMLNCIYDCRYCFLQGMYRSAHYVLFVNYEDFKNAIIQTSSLHQGERTCFFSGYDCDSLALDPVTRFCEFFLPVFEKLPDVELELRTKSVQIRQLLDREPLTNCIIAFSFTPDGISQVLEKNVPAVTKRLNVLEKLQGQGWKIGLRFDPLIYDASFESQYQNLFQQIFTRIDTDSLHSVSLGTFRLPRPYFKTMKKLYPDVPLFAGLLQENQSLVSYNQTLNQRMIEFCSTHIRRYVPDEKFFPIYE